MMPKAAYRLFFIWMVMHSALALAQGDKLVDYLPQGAATGSGVQQRFQAFLARQHLADSRLAKLNLAALKRDRIAVELPGGKIVEITRRRPDLQEDTAHAWIGDVAMGGGQAVITVTDGVLIGHVRLTHDTFTIEPLGDELYVISRVLRDRIPPPDRPGLGPVKVP